MNPWRRTTAFFPNQAPPASPTFSSPFVTWPPIGTSISRVRGSCRSKFIRSPTPNTSRGPFPWPELSSFSPVVTPTFPPLPHPGDLEDYLDRLGDLEVTFGGQRRLNFAEAALLIQGSAYVYAKKVEYLFSLVHHALDFIHHGPSRKAKSKTKSKRALLSSDAPEDEHLWDHEDAFLSLDDAIEPATSLDLDLEHHHDADHGDHPDLPPPPPHDDPTTAPTILTLLQPHGAPQGTASHAPHLSVCSVHGPSGALLIDATESRHLDAFLGEVITTTTATVRERSGNGGGGPSPAVNDHSDPNVPHHDGMDLGGGDGDADYPGAVEWGAPEEYDPGLDRDLDPTGGIVATATERSRVELPAGRPSPVVTPEKEEEEEERDPWATEDPSAPGRLPRRPLRKGRDAHWTREAFLRRQETTATTATTPAIATSRWSSLRHLLTATTSTKSTPKSSTTLIPMAPQFQAHAHLWSAWRQAKLGTSRDGRHPPVAPAATIGGDPEANLDGAWSTDGYGDGYDDGHGDGCDYGEDPHLDLDNADEAAIHLSLGASRGDVLGIESAVWEADVLPGTPTTSTQGDHRDEEGQPLPPTPYGQLVARHLRAIQEEAAARQVLSSVQRTVSDWRGRIEPKLEEQDARSPFDVHMDGDILLDRIASLHVEEEHHGPEEHVRRAPFEIVLSTSSASSSSEPWMVCRSFVALLQMVNAGNVRLVANGGDSDVGGTGGVLIAPHGGLCLEVCHRGEGRTSSLSPKRVAPSYRPDTRRTGAEMVWLGQSPTQAGEEKVIETETEAPPPKRTSKRKQGGTKRGVLTRRTANI